MVTSRRSPPFSLVLLGALASGCAGAVPPAVGEDGKRRPDGIAVDPLETPPEARETAASSSGVVALRSPLGIEAAHATVRAFFEAVSREDSDGLMRVLSMDAVWLSPSSRAREPAFSVFSRRFGRLDYSVLSGLTYWTEDAVLEGDAAIASWADVVGAASTTGMPTPTGATALPDALTTADVVVHAPITIGRGASSGLFGSEVILALRRDGDRFVIHRIAEDFILNP